MLSDVRREIRIRVMYSMPVFDLCLCGRVDSHVTCFRSLPAWLPGLGKGEDENEDEDGEAVCEWAGQSGAERSGRGGWSVCVYVCVSSTATHADKVCAVSWIAGSADADLCFAGARVMEGCACVRV